MSKSLDAADVRKMVPELLQLAVAWMSAGSITDPEVQKAFRAALMSDDDDLRSRAAAIGWDRFFETLIASKFKKGI